MRGGSASGGGRRVRASHPAPRRATQVRLAQREHGARVHERALLRHALFSDGRRCVHQRHRLALCSRQLLLRRPPRRVALTQLNAQLRELTRVLRGCPRCLGVNARLRFARLLFPCLQ
eukprot:1455085-Pleurochrysis_carterae.AAC.1